MNIAQLESYNLADAVKFHDKLNPLLWDKSEHLKPEIRDQLLMIAEDFAVYLGVGPDKLKDITISGSNAAYNYTGSSDIDLHLVVDFANNDDMYRELFDAKKTIYNMEHAITVKGIAVELYAQAADQAHHSQGIYSLLNNDWVEIPRRRRADIDDVSVRSKYEDFEQCAEQAVASQSLSVIDDLLKKIRTMRQSGLDQHGEFGAENLAFKLLRNTGIIEKLRNTRTEIRNRELSLKEREVARPVTYGYGSDYTSESFAQYKQVLEMFKLPARVKKMLAENKDNTIQDETKQAVFNHIWSLNESLSKFNTSYAKLLGYQKGESLYRLFNESITAKEQEIIDKLLSICDATTSSPRVNQMVDIIELRVIPAGHRVEISIESNQTVSAIQGDLIKTKSGEIKHVGIDNNLDTVTAFTAAGSIDPAGIRVWIGTHGISNDGSLELNGWQINFKSDSVSKKFNKFVKEHMTFIAEVGITPDGTNPTTAQFTNEDDVDTMSDEDILEDFINFCAGQLNLEQLPQVKLRRDPQWSVVNKTFGRYNHSRDLLEVAWGQRHVMDVLRTVAHELTHAQQHERESLPATAGDTGSPFENEANARAGILMREYAQLHPEFFNHGLKESWQFKPCSLTSIELSAVLQKAYQSLYEQTGSRWYPHRCSQLAQHVIKSQRNLLKENSHLDTLFDFQKSLKNIDDRDNITIQIGKSVAIIRVIPHTTDGVIELQGFKTPKKIKHIFKDDNNDIEWLEFTDGSTYPDQHFVAASKGGGELEGTNTLFFASKQDADHAELSIKLSIPVDWKLAAVNLNESSGYIPTAAQANDPRFEMALTADVRPGATGKNANKLLLNTDSQGHPQVLRPDGMVQRMMEELYRYKNNILTEDALSAKQVLSYIKKIHPKGEFRLDSAITNHPLWVLTNVPISSLHIDSEEVSPYGQINWIDYDHVDSITPQDIKAKPIVADANGWILDGNHRAVRARDLGLKSIPAYVPDEEAESDEETYDQFMARRAREQGTE